MNKAQRFRGLHSNYDRKTNTYHIYTYDPTTKDNLTELLITGSKVTILLGILKAKEAA